MDAANEPVLHGKLSGFGTISQKWPELTKRPDLTDKGFGEVSENLSTRVSV
jgi:hypothetical protein